MPDRVNGDKITQHGRESIGKIVVNGQPPTPPQPPRRTLLLLLANPTDAPQLRLDEEHRAIRKAVADGRYRDRIDVQDGPAPRRNDLYDLLSRHEPTVVHYAGHGAVDGLALLDPYGGAAPVPPAALVNLFAVHRGRIRCVVLNACLTQAQASAIAAHVPCVVGMSSRVLDAVAIEFATGFHRALADGKSVATAFEVGRYWLTARGLPASEPVLIDPHGEAAAMHLTD